MVRKTTFKPFLLLIITLLCAVTVGFGQSIFSNPITGTNPSADNPFNDPTQTKDPNISVYGIGRGPGLNPPLAVTGNRYSARSWSTGATLDATDYFEIKITPNSGYAIDYTSLQYNGQRSTAGPPNIEIRSSIDGYSSTIGTQTITLIDTPAPNTVNLSITPFQNIATSVTFRIYAWGGTNGNGTFSINDFTFNGNVSAIPACSSSTIWNGANWSGGIPPTIDTNVTINGSYNTAIDGSFSACSLIVSASTTLTIADNDYVVVANNLNVSGNVLVQPTGAFVQLDDTGIVNLSGAGTIKVDKETAPMNNWYEYTYWSSPVSGAEIGTTLTNSEPSRRFVFNAQNYLDATMETANNNATVAGQDDIDDSDDDWQAVNGSTVMQPGIGYATTLTQFAYSIAPGTSNKQFRYTFEGTFNNGVKTVPVYRNDSELNDNNWNLIGNPYPSAIDADLFLAANTNLESGGIVATNTIDGAIFLWSQNTNYSDTANGNQNLNFSDADYAIINGTGELAGGDGLKPERRIPSGQAFFVSMSNSASASLVSGDVYTADVIFNNSMRVRGAADNSQFFKDSNSKDSSSNLANKLWIDLTSNNGVFNQTLVGFINGATNNDDGMYYDAPKNESSGSSAILYTKIDGSSKKFAIQGKAANNLDINETIHLGFKTNINVDTQYSLSIAQLQGDFLTNNTIYLKDNLLNKVLNLSESDYTFTSEVGEFNERFVVMFNNESLSTDDLVTNPNTLKIIDLGNDQITFKTSNNLKMKNVSVFDLLGRQLYQFKAQNSEETYILSNLKQAIYIAKIELSNGVVITKKAIKK